MEKQKYIQITNSGSRVILPEKDAKKFIDSLEESEVYAFRSIWLTEEEFSEETQHELREEIYSAIAHGLSDVEVDRCIVFDINLAVDNVIDAINRVRCPNCEANTWFMNAGFEFGCNHCNHEWSYKEIDKLLNN